MAAKGGRRCMEDALPEEVLHEVLIRVGNVKDLFMLAVTCRRWLRRFTDPAFLRGVVCPSQQGVGHRARLLGFFFRQKRLLSFLRAPGSQLGPTLTSSFNYDGTFNHAEPLAARRGIVLMQLLPGSHLLGLCNPITGERHLLPRLKCYGGDVGGYAIITAADSSDVEGSSRFAFSQVLILSSVSNVVYRHSSYSAATHTWSAPTVCVSDPRLYMVGDRSGVVHAGAAHWLWMNRVAGRVDDVLYKLSVDVGTLRASLTELPVRVGGSPLLCVSQHGKLSVACVYLEHVTVWTQQPQGAAAWLRAAVIRIPTAAPDPRYPREKWVDFDRGSMLVKHRSSGVFILDLQMKTMEKIMEDRLLPMHDTRSVAYEMDLVEFFLLRLVCLCREPQLPHGS